MTRESPVCRLQLGEQPGRAVSRDECPVKEDEQDKGTEPVEKSEQTKRTIRSGNPSAES
jgi:hypothetical protein